MNAVGNYSACLKQAGSADDIKKCSDAMGDPATFLPKDRRNDETLGEYLDRKQDDWNEIQCRDAQCRQEIELRRIRRFLEQQKRN
jgi:hypothetical protein